MCVRALNEKKKKKCSALAWSDSSPEHQLSFYSLSVWTDFLNLTHIHTHTYTVTPQSHVLCCVQHLTGCVLFSAAADVGMMNHPPIPITELAEHTELLKANDNLKLSQEYEVSS